jgi:integrase/recombinase XerD
MPRKGRPKGTTGRAAVLSSAQVRHVFRIAKARARLSRRAEAVFALSLGLGLRAKELAALKCGDVYDENGIVRSVLHLKAAYTKASRTRDVFVSSPQVRQLLATYGEEELPWRTAHPNLPLFPSQKRGHLTPSSMARFLTALYREAGLSKASSHSGRRTLITRLAERGIDLKAIAELAGHSSIRTTAMYVEANPERLARILQEMRW